MFEQAGPNTGKKVDIDSDAHSDTNFLGVLHRLTW